MSDDLARREGDIGWAIWAVMASTIAAGGVKVAAVASGHPEIDALAPVAGALGATFVQGLKLRSIRRAAPLTTGYLSAAPPGTSPECAATELMEIADADPQAQDSIYETFRKMVDAIDDSAVQPLGRLLYLYTHGQLVDPKLPRLARKLFRAGGRLLCELDGEQLNALRWLLLQVATKPGEVVDAYAQATAAPPETLAVAKLLVHHDLADLTRRGGAGGGGPDPARVRMVRIQAEAMLAAIDPGWNSGRSGHPIRGD